MFLVLPILNRLLIRQSKIGANILYFHTDQCQHLRLVVYRLIEKSGFAHCHKLAKMSIKSCNVDVAFIAVWLTKYNVEQFTP